MKRISFTTFKAAFKLSFALRKGTDIDGTVAMITSGVRLRGTNLWLLLASAALASIGLDTNSTAVIIGAMLVSPLMSPILAVGLAVATVDRHLLWGAIRSLSIAVALSLIVSVVYFWISPLGVLTDEISARTVPTLLDVGIALFGGLAGIVAMSRIEKTNAIPGVAIATALMPPLCSAGFGIAKVDAAVFFGAFYLFFLNAVFISVATFVICRLLGFPRHEVHEPGTRNREPYFVAAFVLAVTVPSVILLVRVVDRQRLNRNIQKFVRAEIDGDLRTALRWNVSVESEPDQLRIYLAGEPIEPDNAATLQAKLPEYGVQGYELHIIEAGLSQSTRQAMIGEVSSDMDRRLDALRKSQETERMAREAELASAKEALRKLGGDPSELDALRGELAVAFPDIVRAIYATGLTELTDDATSGGEPPARVVFVSFRPGIGSSQRRRLRVQFGSYLEQRLKVRPVVVLDQPRVPPAAAGSASY